MDNNEVQLVGGPCGHHGPYTFYKAFRYTKNGVKRIMTLSEFFFVKLWIDSDLVCIGELQLLWMDKNSDQVLSSLRLYFLPENTPEGRMDHGEDEVLAISEKVVLRVEDLITWITWDAEWTWGRLGRCHSEVQSPTDREDEGQTQFRDCSLDLSDVDKEKRILDTRRDTGPTVIILSYPRYCRYRAMMKRLEGVENEYLKHKLVAALGGFTVTSENTRVLFCRDTFDYPDLEGHELLCNHLAPKLKGRPRGRRKKRSVSPGSESNESESSSSNAPSTSKPKITTEGGRNGLRCDATTSPRRSTRSTENGESKTFMKNLHAFMKTNHTPIGRIPQCGYKELDLFAFYTRVQRVGGYEAVMTNRLWKSIFDELSGNHNSTSAATVIRRHYERFLLPYERHVRGEEYKPMSVTERRRLKSKNNSTSDAETSESTSESGKCSPIPSTSYAVPATPPPQVDCKDFNPSAKPEGKTSSLRSVRVKSDRMRDTLKDKTPDKSDNESPLKAEPPEEPDVKPAVSLNSKTVPAKDSEPLTSAVAPVAQETSSLSPAECKEEAAVLKTEEAASAGNKDDDDDDVVEVPYKPSVGSDEECKGTDLNASLTQDVKRRKLDILKEGGLEVTPVAPAKDIRPSVIQQATTPRSLSADAQYMPPPPSNTVPVKRSAPQQVPVGPPLKPAPPPQFNYINGQSPPKVVQSKSIYSYSEKTVYGNPRDIAAPTLHPVHSPRVGVRQSGGDVLDLRVTSPQKPVVEIMRVPAVASALPLNPRDAPKRTAPMPLIAGRPIGSNLEITLVGPQGSAKPHYSVHNQHKYSASAPTGSYGRKFPHKRTLSDSYANSKYSRSEENGKTLRTGPAMQHMKPNGVEINVPSPYGKGQPHMKTAAQPSTNSKQFQNVPPPPVFPNYLPFLQSPGKAVPPFLPMMDPLYLSALQSMYPSNSVAPPHPLLPMATPEHLQLYSELVAQNARARFPFPFPDANPSVAAENKKL